jgi:hypothetical protein
VKLEEIQNLVSYEFHSLKSQTGKKISFGLTRHFECVEKWKFMVISWLSRVNNLLTLKVVSTLALVPGSEISALTYSLSQR